MGTPKIVFRPGQVFIDHEGNRFVISALYWGEDSWNNWTSFLEVEADGHKSFFQGKSTEVVAIGYTIEEDPDFYKTLSADILRGYIERKQVNMED
ncbi:hypothetical protein BN1088_1431066 [Sphingobacterium sp. PM2-P1-29]|nr:hypothetical protein BN1088_1431066 [Sphingobacterium sp. PM2-P1-29]